MSRLLIISLFIVLFTSSCLTYEEVDIKEIDDIKVENLLTSSKQTKLILKIKIHNPNTYTIKIKDADLNLFIGKKDLGKLKLQDVVVLKKKTEKVQTITLLPSSKSIFRDALKGATVALFTGKIRVRVKGRIKGKALGIGKWFDVDHSEQIDLAGKSFF